MCLHVRSASSGPRERDSSFTLENSSLRGETEGRTQLRPEPGRTARASSGNPAGGHSVRSGFPYGTGRGSGHRTGGGVRRLDPREARQPGTPELAGQDPALPESRPHGDVGTVPPRVVR